MCNNRLLIRYIRWKKTRKERIRYELKSHVHYFEDWNADYRKIFEMWQWCHSILQGHRGGATLEEEKEIVRISGEVCVLRVCRIHATRRQRSSRKGKIVYVYMLESMNEVEYHEPPPRDYYHSLLSFREKWNIQDITWMEGYWDI